MPERSWRTSIIILAGAVTAMLGQPAKAADLEGTEYLELDPETELQHAYREGFRDGRREGIAVGRSFDRHRYRHRVLDREIFYERHGRHLSSGDLFLQLDGGTEIIIDADSGVVREIFHERRPRGRFVERREFTIPPEPVYRRGYYDH